jgi:hypothetical protein
VLEGEVSVVKAKNIQEEDCHVALESQDRRTAQKCVEYLQLMHDPEDIWELLGLSCWVSSAGFVAVLLVHTRTL